MLEKRCFSSCSKELRALSGGCSCPAFFSSLKHSVEMTLPPVTKTAATLCKETLLPSGASQDRVIMTKYKRCS